MCTNDWKKISNNSCFWLSNVPSNFKNASEACVRKGGKLTSISTKDEYDFLRKEFYDSTSSNIEAWIGLYKKANAKTFTYTPLNTEPDYASLGVKFVQIPEKDFNIQNEYCVTMLIAKDEPIWEAKQCDHKLHSYVCQTDIYKGRNDRNI